jgi:VanZ family protein
MPGSDIPSYPILDQIDFDKFVHCGLFACLVFLFSFPFKQRYLKLNFLYIFIAVAALAYGVGMEYVQKYFTSDRDFDVLDMVADGVGCLLGFLYIQWLLRSRVRRA